MKTKGMLAGAIALSVLATGCATKKYVAKTVAPIEQRVGAAENKNADQDKQISSQGKEIEDLDRDLSRTKERLTDTDNKAAQAAQAASAADQKAQNAQQSANGARQAAESARTFADQGLTRLSQSFNASLDAANKFRMLKSETVLFGVDKSTLTKEAQDQLDGLAREASVQDRYVIEVQGFTDKSGPAAYNETLSERRAQAVARYLANEHKIPVRSISMLGSGYSQPVADDKTRDGRKMNRRVEVRLWIPEGAATTATAKATGQ